MRRNCTDSFRLVEYVSCQDNYFVLSRAVLALAPTGHHSESGSPFARPPPRPPPRALPPPPARPPSVQSRLSTKICLIIHKKHTQTNFFLFGKVIRWFKFLFLYIPLHCTPLPMPAPAVAPSQGDDSEDDYAPVRTHQPQPQSRTEPKAQPQSRLFRQRKQSRT